ncbi:MATE family efflux transporter [Lentzea pudingi]|uniref:Probable multidrug resistance protein NorM n=1 Tax=Lentzea pudingi TaxID=1789439 RepID=A0ABQ2IYF7_9PSEU|nr:MATE family efflux transporter [Lentzea pudingi]GGN30545.1 MATE family efflux transporter [Lentzea pudingi]
MTRPTTSTTARAIAKVSLPLMGGMVGNLVMMLVDRITLARYSPDTLQASGPAVFTAVAVITFFTGIAAISRSSVALAFGKDGDSEARHEAALGMVLGAGLGVVLFLLAPLIATIPQIGGQPAHLVPLEAAYLVWAARFGAVMVLNISLASYFNGIGKTTVPFLVGLAGQAVDAVFTVGLVFGRFGLPELGMAGSAIGTLIGTLVMMIGYLVFLPKGFFAGFSQLMTDGRRTVAGRIRFRLRRGVAAGGSAAIEVLGQTAFVWIAAVLGTVALAANNVILSINYLAIIPIIGLGVGCSVLCGNAIGAGDYNRIRGIITVTLLIAGCYIVVISFFQLVTPKLLLMPFGLHDADQRIVDVAVATSATLWTYSLTFLFSMVGSAVLESFGLTRFSFVARLMFVWGMSLPIILWISVANSGDPDFLPLSWFVGSVFEAVIGAVFFWRIRKAIRDRENHLVDPTAAEAEADAVASR